MNLEFYFRSTPLAGGDSESGSQRLVDELIEASAERCRPRECISVRANAAGIEVRMDLHWQDQQGDFEAAQPVIQLAELLAEFCERRNVVWDVGHQHDGYLARIESQACLAAVAEEVATAIRIARALDELIVDDEFVETELANAIVSQSFDRDADWSLALVREESFQRFPEWD